MSNIRKFLKRLDNQLRISFSIMILLLLYQLNYWTDWYIMFVFMWNVIWFDILIDKVKKWTNKIK